MNWRSSPWLVAFVAIIFNLIAMRSYVQHTKATPDILMAVGTDRLSFEVYSKIVSPLGKTGYDGQYYYAIAHAPFAKYGPEVDFPQGRQLRILFPLLGYLASAGNEDWLPYALPCVNLILISLMTLLGAKFAMHHGLSPWHGLTLPICLNALMPAMRNLTDTTAMTMAFALMYVTLLDKKPVIIGLAGLLAVLAREQNIAILALVLGHSLWQRKYAATGAVFVAGLLWGGWVAWLTHVYGSSPFLPSKGNFAAPFEGLPLAWEVALAEWREHTPQVQQRVFKNGIWMLVLLGIAVALVIRQPKEKRPRATVFALMVLFALLKFSSVPNKVFGILAFIYHVGMMLLWIVFAYRMRRNELLPLGMATGGLMLHIIGGPLIFVDYWAYGRAFFWLPMGLWTMAMIARWESLLLCAGATMYFPVCIALHR